MITISQLLVGIVVVGIVGSSLEKIGVALNAPRVKAVGEAIAAIAADLPRFVEKLVAAKNGSSK